MDRVPALRRKIAATAARKLTDVQVASLLEDRRNGATYAELNERYGIKKSAISYIVNGKTKYEKF